MHLEVFFTLKGSGEDVCVKQELQEGLASIAPTLRDLRRALNPLVGESVIYGTTPAGHFAIVLISEVAAIDVILRDGPAGADLEQTLRSISAEV